MCLPENRQATIFFAVNDKIRLAGNHRIWQSGGDFTTIYRGIGSPPLQEAPIRRVHDTRRRPGVPDIRRIRPTVRSRDDIPATPIGLQDPCSDEGTRKRLSGLPGRMVLPGRSRRVGGSGMEPWTILVPGVVKQGPGRGFDRLQEPANGHCTIRRRPEAGPRIMGRGRIRIRIPASG